MVPSPIEIDLPSIGASLRFHPHTHFAPFNAPIPTLAPADVDPTPNTPLHAATYVDLPSSMMTHAPLAGVTPFHPHQSGFSTLSPRPPDPFSTQSPPQSVQNDMGTISKSAQIGIFVCIAVVVVLTLLALILAILSCRRHLRSRRANKQSRDSELNMWETEMRNGRQRTNDRKRRATDRKTGGLWAGLKVGDAGREEPHTQSENETTERDRVGPMATLWERIGERDRGDARIREESASKEAYPKGQGGMQAYISRDRRSVVSEGSIGIMGNPVAAMSFLDDRR